MALYNRPMERPMSHPFDASRSLTVLEQDSMIIAVIEMSQSKWLVAAVVPGVKRQPLKRFDPDEEALRKLLHRWRNDADRAGSVIKLSRSFLRPDATASGWRAGCGRAVSRPTLSIPQVLRCHANTGAQRLIASTQNC